jgi:mutator protein MutT
MQKRPDVSVKLVLRAGDHVLMLHRANGSWEFPGGRLEWGETPEEALRRELIEELDCSIQGLPIFINLYNYIAKDNSRHSVILHYFLKVQEMPQLRTTDEEQDAEVVWLTKNELAGIIPNAKFVNEIYARS